LNILILITDLEKLNIALNGCISQAVIFTLKISETYQTGYFTAEKSL
jgi:hypothetical protein